MGRGRKLQTEEDFKRALKNGYGLGSYKDSLIQRVRFQQKTYTKTDLV
jgi:hypothetical protein